MIPDVAPLSTIVPAQPRTPVLKIGFYGCNDGLVRLSYREARKAYPQTLKLLCPRCLLEHRVAIMWRKRVPEDEGRTTLCLG